MEMCFIQNAPSLFMIQSLAADWTVVLAWLNTNTQHQHVFHLNLSGTNFPLLHTLITVFV